MSPSPEPTQAISPSLTRHYNAAQDLLGRHAQRLNKPAYIDGLTSQCLSFGQLQTQSHQFAHALRQAGFGPESRILLCMHDSLEWPVVFLGCILAGVIPIASNTLLNAKDFDYMLRDSRAQGLIVSETLWPTFEPLVSQLPLLRSVFLAGTPQDSTPMNVATMIGAQTGSALAPQVAETCGDDICFWLYSSGSTGVPKGTVHLHSHLIQTAQLYGTAILGLREDDVVFSAAKLFFAYGLGNALTFPLAVGATTVLLSSRPSPDLIFSILKKFQASIFYGVPTLFAALLAHETRPARSELHLRLCTSAGEALPAEIGRKWSAEFACDLLDGIGSTEMLHIFLSNRPGQVRYGSTGQAVPGYQLRIVGDDGQLCGDGEIGELQVNGPSAALMYWNNRAQTKATFTGEWTRSGDKYTRDGDGFYTYCGRTDDMLKVGGIYVSPFEVEASLMTHPAVLEAAVIGAPDKDDLIKPKAFVVLKPGQVALQEELKNHVKQQLAAYKYPRWIEFVSDLPKTTTGKIQRFRLRERQLKS